MVKKLTTQKIIEKFREVHGYKYDYSLVIYKNTRTKVKIICLEHGTFEQTPNNHLNNHGCPKCGIKNRSKKIASNTEEFIKKATSVHGDSHDYSLVIYINAHTKVKIICPEHGVFEQKPNDHLNGHGCPKCGGTKKLNKEEFIKKATSVHENRYDYSLVFYKNVMTKVKIICPVHGIFEQTPHDHLSGRGCPRCPVKISKPEQELADYISSLGHNIVQSHRGWCQDRPQLEIDIYIPELNLGFEFNGSYWHSLKPKNYHKEKTKLALRNNIKLIHIWEGKWINKPEQIKRMIRKRLSNV